MKLNLLIFSLLCCTFQLRSQVDFFYNKEDSVLLEVDTTRCTIEFIEVANESFLISNGIPFFKMSDKMYEVTGSYENINIISAGIYETQRVYRTEEGICLRLRSEVVLNFKSTTTQTEIADLESMFDMELIDQMQGWLRTYKVSDPLQVSKLLNESELVEFCDPNFILPTVRCSYIPNDEYFNR
jgi:hypothetical protein